MGEIRMALKFIRRIKPFDRRRNIRLNVSCLAKYSVGGSAKSGATLTNLVNLSEMGALVVTFDKQLFPKTKIELQFQLPGASKPVAAQGEVVRSSQRKRNIYLAGVQFQNLKDDARRIILDFMSGKNSLKRRSA
jgi:c-di-GMP-binding flagellar brake protein YcgR